MTELGAMLFILFLLAVTIGTFIRICIRLRKGGGSLTTIALGAMDGFMTQEKSKAAEVIVDENAGKKYASLLSADPKDPKETER
ncbi:MAG: hypothetical protein ACM3Q4_08155 [Acidobacteriota bacterium]